MPPVIIWALGTIGALALAKLLANAARKANAELDDIRRERAVERPVEKLERDPATGEYRPRKS
ncbi:MAG: hypothetical protein WD207_02625 [Xanthobacteraceae bacterium]